MSEPATPQEIYRALQRRARSEGRGTQELFEFYLLERFLYRLSVSHYRDRFVLKGGLLLTALGVRRPTRDADVLAWGVAGDEETLLAVIREVASIPADDGMTFDVSQARAMAIREHAAYPGTRIVIPVALGTARLQLRLDVNVGDPVGPQKIDYPTLFSDEPIELLSYPVESVIAEKVETMISRGDANTRERDYADVLALSRIHTVGVRGLRRALEQTAIHLSAFCSRGLCSVIMLLMQKPYNSLKVTANNPVNQSMLTLRIRNWEVWHREVERVLTLVRPQPRR